MSTESTAVAVKKSRRGYEKFATNPFLKDAAENSKIGTRRITNKNGDKCMIISEEGEIMAPAGFHQVVEVEKTTFVKLYINGVKAFQGLSPAGTKVFEIIYRAVQEKPGGDSIYIHFASINQDVTPISEATFYRGMREMIEKRFIVESTSPALYFFNVDYLFNGNRLAFIKEIRLKSMDMAGGDTAPRPLRSNDNRRFNYGNDKCATSSKVS